METKLFAQYLAVVRLSRDSSCRTCANSVGGGTWAGKGHVAEVCDGNSYHVRPHLMFSHVVICIWYLGLEGGYLESEGKAGEGWHVGKNDWVFDGNNFAKE
jgi:hypothetical protein